MLTLALPLGPRHAAAQPAHDSGHASKSYTRAELQLQRAVVDVVRGQAQLNEMLTEAWSRGLQPWFVGGTAASILHYARSRLQAGESIPAQIHFFDVFAPGQDIDVAIDAPFKTGVQTFGAWVHANANLKISIEGKRAWDFMTLRMENGRGFVGDPILFLQNTDSLSLGLLQVPSFDREEHAEIRYAPTFDDETARENPFMDSILRNEITFIERDSHRQSILFKKGLNPEIISVLRIVNKAVRFAARLDAEAEAKLERIVEQYLATGGQEVGSAQEYVRGRMQRIVRGALLGSKDAKQALALLRKYKVNRVLRKAGVNGHQFQEIMALERAMAQLGRGLALNQLKRVPIDRVKNFPEGSIIEGTTLFGGARPPVLVRSSLLDAGAEIIEIADLVKNFSETNAMATAMRMSKIAFEYTKKILDGTVKSPIYYLSDMSSACAKDCRDYSIVGQLLFAAAGVTSHITSNQSFTKVIVELKHRTFLLNTHVGGAEWASVVPTPQYIQNVWLPKGEVYVSPQARPRAWHLQALFQRHRSEIPSLDSLENIIDEHEDLKISFRDHLWKKMSEGSLDYLLSWRAFQGQLPRDQNIAEIEDFANENLDRVLSGESNLDQIRQLVITIKRLPRDTMTFPENMRMLKTIDFLMSGSQLAAKSDLKEIAVKLLHAADAWVSPGMRQALFVMLLPHVDVSNDLQGLSWNRMRKPSADRLPMARAYFVSTGRRFFLSVGAADYSHLSLDDAKRLMEHDVLATAGWSNPNSKNVEQYDHFIDELYTFAAESTGKREKYLHLLSASLQLAAPSEISRRGVVGLPTFEQMIFQSGSAEFEVLSPGIRAFLAESPVLRSEIVSRAPASVDGHLYGFLIDVASLVAIPTPTLYDEQAHQLSTYLRKVLASEEVNTERQELAKRAFEKLSEFYRYRHPERSSQVLFARLIQGKENSFASRFGAEFTAELLLGAFRERMLFSDTDQRSEALLDLLKSLRRINRGQRRAVMVSNALPYGEWMNLLATYFFTDQRGGFRPDNLAAVLRRTDEIITLEGNVSWGWLNQKTLAQFNAVDLSGLDLPLIREIFADRKVYFADMGHKELLRFWYAFAANPFAISTEFVQKYPEVFRRISNFFYRPGQDVRIRDHLLHRYAHEVAAHEALNPMVMEMFSRWVRTARAQGHDSALVWLESEFATREPRVHRALQIIYQEVAREILGAELGGAHSGQVTPESLCQKYLEKLL